MSNRDRSTTAAETGVAGSAFGRNGESKHFSISKGVTFGTPAKAAPVLEDFCRFLVTGGAKVGKEGFGTGAGGASAMDSADALAKASEHAKDSECVEQHGSTISVVS